MARTSSVGMMVDVAYGRTTAGSTFHPCLSPQAVESIPGNSTATMLALATASKAWWESCRPQGWTLEQHLVDPTIGCNSTEDERPLAEAVAACFRHGARGRGETQAVTATHGGRRLAERYSSHKPHRCTKTYLVNDP